VAVLNQADTSTGLTGWVTIDNRSGTPYPNALLKLVAGDIHRVQQEVRKDRMVARASAMEAAARNSKRKPFSNIISTH